jgi:pilus assembly protein Flp/PilA
MLDVSMKIKPKRRINTMMELMKRFMKQEEGQDLVEYALLLVFLALAAIAVLPTLGKAVNNVFSQSASTLTAGS